MKRIILHWTAGQHLPNDYEKERYHFLVDAFGGVHSGKYKPEANLDCKDGEYAQHCGGGNTGSIGVSICAMAGFKDKNNMGDYPITKIQFETTMKLCAKLAKQYSIDVTPDTVLTHAEFNKRNKIPKVKIDILFIPPYPWISKEDCGRFIRSKIKWYMKNG